MESFILAHNHYHDLIMSWGQVMWTSRMPNSVRMLLDWIGGRSSIGTIVSDSGNPYNGQKGMPNIIHPPDRSNFYYRIQGG